jgi:hypothetical protein
MVRSDCLRGIGVGIYATCLNRVGRSFASKIQFGLNRIYRSLGTGFVGIAAGRSRDAYCADQ